MSRLNLLFAVGMSSPPWLADLKDHLPPWTTTTQLFGVATWQWLGLLALALGSFLVSWGLQWLILAVSGRLVRGTRLAWDADVAHAATRPLRYGLTFLIFYLLDPLLDLPPQFLGAIDLIIRSALVLVGMWLLLRLAGLAGAALEVYLARQTTDPILQRSIRTQILVPLRIFRFLVVVLGIALVLIQFDVVRTLGLSMLASAGVAGIVIGLAAQRTVANLLAGIQLAVFQHIRIGDAVVVENEWGVVEEIGLTYVVIKVWDDRRLILPVSYMLDKPFQNWTRTSANLLGTVYLVVDYTVPVEEIRAELGRVLEQSPLWDRRTQSLQVTNFLDKGVELRAVVSGRDGGELWDLRCFVREKLLAWLQAKGGRYLPVQRVERLGEDRPSPGPQGS